MGMADAKKQRNREPAPDKPDNWDSRILRVGVFVLGAVIAINEFVIRGYYITDPTDGAPRIATVAFAAACIGIPVGTVVDVIVKAIRNSGDS